MRPARIHSVGEARWITFGLSNRWRLLAVAHTDEDDVVHLISARAAPVYADETVRVEWLVVKVTHHARLRGDIVGLRGRIRGQDGQTAVGAKGRVLVTDEL